VSRPRAPVSARAQRSSRASPSIQRARMTCIGPSHARYRRLLRDAVTRQRARARRRRR
jgi:hypothetical protein